MSLAARLITLLVGLLALIGTHWRAYTMGSLHEHNSYQADQARAVHDDAETSIQRENKIIEVTHERSKTELRISDDRLAAAGELERMRRDIAEARSDSQRADACSANVSARDQLLRAMEADIEQLAEQGAQIAAAADGHVADTLMLQNAMK